MAAEVRDDLSLTSWGLPESVLQSYHNNHIRSMFPWQADCLCTGNVLRGGNLVFSAPTSAGKTLVAELLMLKRVLETRKKAMMILPFVSVAREKTFYLQTLFQDAGVRVGGFMGGESPPGGLKNIDIAVCTIEKANSLVNRLLEEGQLHVLGILVADELHMVGNPSRGYLLELLLTKVRYVMKTGDKGRDNVQIVGMSATLPNLDLLARWLDADLYRTTFRPVPLVERVKIGREIYDSAMKKVGDFTPLVSVRGDDEHIVSLCLEVILGGNSVLIFCPTKNWCEKLSETIAREFYNLLNCHATLPASNQGLSKSSEVLATSLDRTKLRDVIEQLRRTPVGLDQMLGRVVPYGVAYHHAGLTFDERDIVEGSFRAGALRVLVATSTLSSGVNLPARRVIVRTPMFHGAVIDTLSYKQMVGRAGRKGVDTAGESILLCKPTDRSKASKLVQSHLEPVFSCLVNRNDHGQLSSSLKRAILEIVVSGAANSPTDVVTYAACTLLAASVSHDQSCDHDAVSGCVEYLSDNEFVRLQEVTTAEGSTQAKFYPTQLGYAVMASSLSPDEGLTVFLELQRARRCFVLENDLHMLYQVTPIYAANLAANIDWYQYLNLWEALSPDMKRVAELVGVQESFLARSVGGVKAIRTTQQARTLAIHRRFYTTLILHDLVNETPLTDVARKYGCNKGQLQALQQSAATFAGMVTVFSARLGWSTLELILSQFQSRLTFGVQRELCDLVRVSIVNGQRARSLHDAGYRTLTELAAASPADIENVLKNSAPFQSVKQGEQESEWEAAQRKKARSIWVTGQRGLTEYEAAIAVKNEAKKLVQEDAGDLKIDWEHAEHRNDGSAAANRSIRLCSRFKDGLRRRSKAGKIGKLCDDGSDSADMSSDLSVLMPPSSTTLRTNGIRHVDVCGTEAGMSRAGSREMVGVCPGRDSSVCGEDEETGMEVDSRVSLKKEAIETTVVDLKEQVKVNESVNANLCLSSVNSVTESKKLTSLDGVLGKGAKCSGLYRPKTSKHQFDVDKEDVGQTGFYLVGVRVDNEIVDDGEMSEINPKNPDKPELKEDEAVNLSNRACQLTTSSENLSLDLESSFDRSLIRQISNSDLDVDFSQFPMTDVVMTVPDKNTPASAKCMGIEKKDCVEISSELCADSNNEVKRVVESVDVLNMDKTNGSIDYMTEVEYRSTDAKNSFVDSFNDSFCVNTQMINLFKKTQDGDIEVNEIAKCENKSANVVSPNLYSEQMSFDKDSNVSADCLNERVEDEMDVSETNESLDLLAASNYDRLDYHDNDRVNNDDSFDALQISGKSANRLSCANNSANRITVHGDVINSQTSDIPVSPIPGLRPMGKSSDSGGNFATHISSTPDNHVTTTANERTDEALTFSMLNAMYDCDFKSQFKQNREISIDFDNKQSEKLISEECDRCGDAVRGTGCTNGHENKIDREQIDDFSRDKFDDMFLDNSRDTNVLNEMDLNIPIASKPAQKQNDYNNHEITKELTNDSIAVVTPLRRSNRKRKNSETSDGSPNEAVKTVLIDANISGESDCVPPTPPEDRSLKADSPLKSIQGTPIRAGLKSCFYKSCFVGDGKRFRRKVNEEFSSVETVDSIDRGGEKVGSRTVGLENHPGKRLEKNVTFTERTIDVRKRAAKCAISARNTRTRTGRIAIRQTNTVVTDTDTERLNTEYVANNNISPSHSTKTVDNESGTSDVCTNSPSLSTTLSDQSQWFTDYTERRSQDADQRVILRISPSPPPEIGTPGHDGVSPTQGDFAVIDVCAHVNVFYSFMDEWKRKSRYSVCLACERVTEDRTPVIGAKYTKADDHDESLAPPPQDVSITVDTRVTHIRNVLESREATVTIFDAKQQHKTLVDSCGVRLRGKVYDPKVAAWMLDPTSKPPTLHRLVTDLLPAHAHLLDGIGGGVGTGSLGLTTDSGGSSRLRSTTEAVVSLHMMDVLYERLTLSGLVEPFVEVEMPVRLVIGDMELNGMGFSNSECEVQKTMMQAKLSALESDAYEMAGHVFSLTSSDDVSRVLYHELRLPPNGDPDSANLKTHAANRHAGKQGRVKSHLSTSKEVLNKLRAFHPLPAVVLEWRRISAALTKVVFPMQKVRIHNRRTMMDRIFGDCGLHTATGRVTMSEPNLQNVPNDFEIQIPDMIGESPTAQPPITGRNTRSKGQNSAQRQKCHMIKGDDCSMFAVSMRHAFVPFKGGVLVAADYCQLELRMIAHLSRDKKLVRVINAGGDVFRQIAAQWMNVGEGEVTPEQRQNAKQICYGMIYGIGAKALGQQLGVEEDEASAFIETFKSTFTGMRRYLRDTVQFCREKGYVKTILSRRRYLPDIRHSNPHVKAHAERQAVNTTIQGSAADLVKKAMVAIDQELQRTFAGCRYTHRHPTHAPEEIQTRSSAVSTNRRLSGGYLILQLHDELIYEVTAGDVKQVASIIRRGMETALSLAVKLPVKIKVGPSWGKLVEVEDL